MPLFLSIVSFLLPIYSLFVGGIASFFPFKYTIFGVLLSKYSIHVGGIACYIRKVISPHIQLHKIDPLNQYIWIEISDTNAKKMHIEICYFAPINSTFMRKII
jgi:hypothetical protein